MNDETYAQLKELIYLTHPLGVTLCEVIVNRYDVNALAGNGIEVNRHRSNECLTFTRLHLGDTTLMEDDSADNLNSVRLHAENSPGSLSDSSKCFREKRIQRFAFLISLSELVSLAGQIVI